MWLDQRYLPLEALDDPSRRVVLARDALSPLKRGELYVIKEAVDRERRDALHREVAVLSQLDHRSIRQVRAFEECDDRTVAAFEHVDGVDLEEHLTQRPGDAMECLIALLRVLVHIHARRRSHGDLKPANVLVPTVGAPDLALIDLGLSMPLGEPVRGGTPGYLAPEYSQGGSASVAGDLFALGTTFREAIPPEAIVPESLGDLLDACLSIDPADRPASAEAALASLGQFPRPIDRLGAFTARGVSDQEHTARAILESFDGTSLAIEAPNGFGRTRLSRALTRHVLQHERSRIADSSFARNHNPLMALATILAPRLPADPVQASVLGAISAARRGISLILDDGDDCSKVVRSALPLAAALLKRLGRGSLVVIGASQELAEELEQAGAHRRSLARTLSEDQVREMAGEVGAHLDEARFAALRRCTQGRPGAVGRALIALGDRPETPPEELEQVIDRHDAAREGRTMGRASNLSESAVPVSANEAAHAAARQGDLSDAVLLLGAAEKVTPVDLMEQARWLERLGRYEECRRTAEAILSEPSLSPPKVRSGAAIMAAAAAYALGDYKGADEAARAGLLTTPLDTASACHLTALQSDAALARGDVDAALRLAERAQDIAADDQEMQPLALARLGAAQALGGQPMLARNSYAAALEAAEAAGDIVGLPPFIMNLATIEHAMSNFGAAIQHYEEAARLAGQLGRLSTKAITLLNLGGLLTTIGAVGEAQKVLIEASEAARASGSVLYEAQVDLLTAELTARTDPAAARGYAVAAREAFLELDAGRQALEAELLNAELELEISSPSMALALCADRGEELVAAGLEHRAALLKARALAATDDLSAGINAAERALEIAEGAGDLELTARILAFLAATHGRLGTGADRPLLERARETVGKVAARLPTGLRERYLTDDWRGALNQEHHRTENRPVGAVHREVASERAARVLAFVRRVLLEEDDRKVLEAAVDEAVALTQAERAFLLRRRPKGRPVVTIARNIDKETIRGLGKKSRYSRSIAERVLSSGTALLTASAPDDPTLSRATSIHDLGLRSVLCVPIKGPHDVVGALYLDHRFTEGRFSADDQLLVQGMADIIGVAFENARLHREAIARAEELEQLNETVMRENAIRSAQVDHLTSTLSKLDPVRQEEGQGGMIGRSPALLTTIVLAQKVAPSELPVLIEGESGTGKELCARYIHDRSPRAAGPFVAINCGALPEQLLESELFGHTRGAFTGATRDHLGLFRVASGGSLLLDEIGEMPLRMQTRLLRVLQEGEVMPLGSEFTEKTDVRVIAATNRDLEDEVAARRFRQDLYFRLVGLRLVLPPLRERLEDLPLLATTLLERIAKEPGMRPVDLSLEALHELMKHRWQGNVRELQQVLRRAVLIARGKEILPDELQLQTQLPATRQLALRRFDRDLVQQALRAQGGNRTRAAEALGVSRATIHRWIKRYQLE